MYFYSKNLLEGDLLYPLFLMTEHSLKQIRADCMYIVSNLL